MANEENPGNAVAVILTIIGVLLLIIFGILLTFYHNAIIPFYTWIILALGIISLIIGVMILLWSRINWGSTNDNLVYNV